MCANIQIEIDLSPNEFDFLRDFAEQCNDPNISVASILRCMLRSLEEVKLAVQGTGGQNELFTLFLGVLEADRSGIEQI